MPAGITHSRQSGQDAFCPGWGSDDRDACVVGGGVLVPELLCPANVPGHRTLALHCVAMLRRCLKHP